MFFYPVGSDIQLQGKEWEYSVAKTAGERECGVVYRTERLTERERHSRGGVRKMLVKNISDESEK